MRIALKLAASAVLAFAAMTLAPLSAFAQNEPLVHNQNPQLVVQNEVHGATDGACPAVTPSPPTVPSPLGASGGCRLHVTAADVELYAHLSAGGTEVMVSNCNVEFDVRIDAAGEGYITHQELTEPDDPLDECIKEACGQDNPPTGEGRTWSFYLREMEPAPTERATVLFCTENFDGSGFAHCEVVLPVSQPTRHAYRFTAQDVSAHGTAFPHCELGGMGGPSSHIAVFNTEALLETNGESQVEQRVEIRHQ